MGLETALGAKAETGGGFNCDPTWWDNLPWSARHPREMFEPLRAAVRGVSWEETMPWSLRDLAARVPEHKVLAIVFYNVVLAEAVGLRRLSRAAIWARRCDAGATADAVPWIVPGATFLPRQSGQVLDARGRLVPKGCSLLPKQRARFPPTYFATLEELLQRPEISANGSLASVKRVDLQWCSLGEDDAPAVIELVRALERDGATEVQLVLSNNSFYGSFTNRQDSAVAMVLAALQSPAVEALDVSLNMLSHESYLKNVLGDVPANELCKLVWINAHYWFDASKKLDKSSIAHFCDCAARRKAILDAHAKHWAREHALRNPAIRFVGQN